MAIRVGIIYDAVLSNYNMLEISAYMNRAKIKVDNIYLYINDNDAREYGANRFHVFESIIDHDITKIEPHMDKSDKTWGHGMDASQVLDMFKSRFGYHKRRQ